MINEGKFDTELIELFTVIKKEAKHAREKEGEYRTTNEEEHAFELWLPVLENCVTLEQDYYNNSAVNWAKNRQKMITRKRFVISVIAAFIGGSIVTYLVPYLLKLMP